MKSIAGPMRRIRRQRTAKQLKRNRAFRTCCTWWKKNYTIELAEQWLLYAPHNLTSFNAFLSVNIMRIYNDLPITPTPPLEL